MKSVKLGIVAICIGLLGLSIATNNFVSICGGALAVLLAIIAYCFDDKKGE